jgi:tripartite-type tricarboxylate transporter receptor subunit TctC
MALLLTLGLAGPVYADAWPGHPIRIINGFPAATASDSTARMLAAELQILLKQPVYVENKVGAQGAIAASYVARSNPDGYTLLMSSGNIVAQNPALYKKLTYDPIKDFSYIGRVATFPFVFAVASGSPLKSLSDLLAYAKDPAHKVNYGYGNGTGQIVGAALINEAKVNASPIAYSSSPQGLLDLVGGEVTFMVTDIPAARPFVDGGRVRMLAVSTKAPSALVPTVPTVAGKANLPDFDIVTWVALAAPVKTPPAVIKALDVALVKILRRQDIARKMTLLGGEIAPLDAEDMDKYVRQQIVFWGQKIRSAGIEPQ